MYFIFFWYLLVVWYSKFGGATEKSGELLRIVMVVKSTSVHGKERARAEAISRARLIYHNCSFKFLFIDEHSQLPL